MRGIIEVVVLNLGLELDIISKNIYSMLIIMTLISNFFASSLSLHLNNKLKKPAN
jgi:Kef-type K+ transport system membrane component KefB